MWELLKANPFLVGALSGSLAAYILGLIVSYLRREKRWLGYSVSSRNIVERGDAKLAMTYDGRDISRLDSHTVILRNIGNRALKELPVRLDVLTDGKIVDHEVSVPEGAKYSATLEGESLVVTLDLLNPGEVFTVGLTVADALRRPVEFISHGEFVGERDASQVRVIARGEFLEVREIAERANTEELLEIFLPRIPFGGLLSDLHRFSRARERK